MIVTRAIAPTFESWRAAARDLLARDIDPATITWIDDTQAGLWTMSEAPAPISPTRPAPRVPPEFLGLAELASYHRDPARWSLLYRLLHRLTHGEPDLLARAVDPDITSLRARVAAIRRDEHKMHAFVRFRRVVHDGSEHFIAWHRPDNLIVPLAAPFFARRFANMRWTILTPDASATWDGDNLHFGPGAPRSTAPSGDDLDDLFLTYYRSTFNPARLNLKAMRAEMPRKHWDTLPEASTLHELVKSASARTEAMLAAPASAAAAYVPATRQLPVLRDAAMACRACDLAACATRTVFGEGPQTARLMLVGEQPGDHEDLEGRPFLGPAGQLLDDLLHTAGLDRDTLYITNAVKHFKYTRKAGRRIHVRPNPSEISACRAWLDAEIETVRPDVIVCLGSSAARSFLGPRFNAIRSRGRVYKTPWAPSWLATLHPAAVLRTTDSVARGHALADLQADLHLAASELRRHAQTPRTTDLAPAR